MIFKKNKMWANQPQTNKVVPTNSVLVEMSKVYRKEIPAVLKPGIDQTRDFFLNEIAPQVMGLTNGLQDGIDVLKQAMDENPQASQYFNAMNNMLGVALKTKMATFVADQCGLNAEQREIYFRELFPHDRPDGPVQVIKRLALEGASETPVGNVSRRRRTANQLKNLEETLKKAKNETELQKRS